MIERKRSGIILDEDDFVILKSLIDNPSNDTLISIELATLKKIVGLSDKGMSIHMKRLKSHNLIKEFREGKEWRIKYITLTPEGNNVLRELLKSPKLITPSNL